MCKKCYALNEYRTNRSERLAIMKVRRDRISKENYAYIAEVKSKPCTDCGHRFPPECMDFDHLDSNTKIDQISKMMTTKILARVKEEISKCELVCACCHRIRTFKRGRQ